MINHTYILYQPHYSTWVYSLNFQHREFVIVPRIQNWPNRSQYNNFALSMTHAGVVTGTGLPFVCFSKGKTSYIASYHPYLQNNYSGGHDTDNLFFIKIRYFSKNLNCLSIPRDSSRFMLEKQCTWFWEVWKHQAALSDINSSCYSLIRRINWSSSKRKMYHIEQFGFKLRSLCFYCTELKIKK